MSKEENKKPGGGVNFNINPQHTPIYYTDNIFMGTSKFGVVLDVGQRIANTNQVQAVCRIGLSREHAKELVDKLAKLLAMTEGQAQTGKKAKN